MSFSLKLEGVDEAINKLRKLDNEIAQDVDKEIGMSVVDMHNSMTRIVPVDNGFLKNSIKYERKGLMHWVIGAYMPYAAYLNWGTINRVRVTAFWSNYAALFKGKGIRKSGGIYPTFFFTGVVDREKPKMIDRIKKIVEG